MFDQDEDWRRVEWGLEEDWRCEACLRIAKNDMLCVACLPPLCRYFKLSHISQTIEKVNLWSNDFIESAWDVMWFGIESLLSFIWISYRLDKGDTRIPTRAMKHHINPEGGLPQACDPEKVVSLADPGQTGGGRTRRGTGHTFARHGGQQPNRRDRRVRQVWQYWTVVREPGTLLDAKRLRIKRNMKPYVSNSQSSRFNCYSFCHRTDGIKRVTNLMGEGLPSLDPYSLRRFFSESTRGTRDPFRKALKTKKWWTCSSGPLLIRQGKSLRWVHCDWSYGCFALWLRISVVIPLWLDFRGMSIGWSLGVHLMFVVGCSLDSYWRSLDLHLIFSELSLV